jgi:hypothetical protein
MRARPKEKGAIMGALQKLVARLLTGLADEVLAVTETHVYAPFRFIEAITPCSAYKNFLKRHRH